MLWEGFNTPTPIYAGWEGMDPLYSCHLEIGLLRLVGPGGMGDLKLCRHDGCLTDDCHIFGGASFSSYYMTHILVSRSVWFVYLQIAQP